MPSWPIHIALAHKLNKQLKLNDDFILGNIMPDVLDGYVIKPSNKTEKKQSHYYSNKKINPENFVKENKNELHNPIILGYLIHLLTDKFYNEETAKHFINENNNLYVVLNDNTKAPKNLETFGMKHQDLDKYGKMLAQNNLLGNKIILNNNTFNNIKHLKQFNYNTSDIESTIKIINDWIYNKINIANKDYKLYSQKELDEIYENCYQYILNYLKNLKETK
ncbi:MAG: hypothetical protein HFH45_00600 [Bacilli bacterium]|nr:hypothetical protein [Bacilli bacterium]